MSWWMTAGVQELHVNMEMWGIAKINLTQVWQILLSFLGQVTGFEVQNISPLKQIQVVLSMPEHKWTRLDNKGYTQENCHYITYLPQKKEN